jgi:hypothetical protein
VALTLELAQTVALGPFNPYIITPEWLARTGILPAGEAEIRFKVIGEGAAFEFQGVGWEVDLRRLVVSSLEHDCGDLVAQVLNELHHTPVRAIGHNFHYSCSLPDWGDEPLPTLGGRTRADLSGVASLEQVRWTGMLRSEGARVEVTCVQGEEQVVVLVNHHRETDPRSRESVMLAAKHFRRDQESSEKLLRSLFNQGVKR